MKFGQLIEHNMRHIFLGKSHPKCDGESSPRPFSGKLKLSISLDQQSKSNIIIPVEGYQNKLKLRCRPLTFTSY